MSLHAVIASAVAHFPNSKSGDVFLAAVAVDLVQIAVLIAPARHDLIDRVQLHVAPNRMRHPLQRMSAASIGADKGRHHLPAYRFSPFDSNPCCRRIFSGRRLQPAEHVLQPWERSV